MVDAAGKPHENALMRSQVYGFAARVFAAEPDEAFLNGLLTPDMQDVFRAFDLNPDTVIASGKPKDEYLSELAVEYTRLFIGPGKHIPPYESVHIDPNGGALFGKPAIAVQHFIEQCGFDYSLNYKELPDHISVELEFMSHLAASEAAHWAAKEQKKAKNYLAIEQRFLADHLLRWAFDFCEKVITQAELPYFRSLSVLVKGFLHFEQKALVTPHPHWREMLGFERFKRAT